MSVQTDEVTGLSRSTIIESKDPDARPRIVIHGGKGTPREYFLMQGAMLTVNDGDELAPGEVIAKVPRETAKTKDITGGLPRVA